MNERSNRFFMWVWRINGLLLLALGLLAVMGATALVFNIGLFWSRDRPEQHLAQVAGANLTAKGFRLGEFRRIAGTQFLYAQLAPPSEYIGSGSSGGLGTARNLLFFDTVTKKAHWFLPDNDQTIRSFSFLMDPPNVNCWNDDGEPCKRDQKAIALLVETEAPQTTAATGGSRTVALASQDGRDLTPIARSIGGLLGYHQPSADSVLVFYVSAGSARVLDAETATRKVRSDALLSSNEQDAAQPAAAAARGP